MGNAHTHHGSTTVVDRAKKTFSPDELHLLASSFEAYSLPGKAAVLTEQQFYAGSGVEREPLAQLLWRDLARRANAASVDFDVFVVAASVHLKGDNADRAQMLATLCDGDDAKLVATIQSISESYLLLESASPEYASWKFADTPQLEAGRLVQFVYDSLVASRKGSPQVSSLDALTKWLANTPTMRAMCDVVFARVFFHGLSASTSFDSRLTTLPVVRAETSMLSVAEVFVLNQSLPCDAREWALLYSSQLHGESFSTLVTRIVDKGALLFVVRERGSNHVFGGFSSQSFSPKPQFFGDDFCFVFQLRPALRVFHSSGQNSNFVYFNLRQETLPNGIGFGGQLEVGGERVPFFGLWLDDESGRSQRCATYDNVPLSSADTFVYDALEVWCVKPPTPRKDIHGMATSGGGLILDKVDPALEAILDMAGKQQHSKGLRAAPDSPLDT